jgi:2-methylisocitrate lyase-like PEP mutase family enzyme
MTAYDDFLARHHDGPILLMPNAWDAGSARLLASLGFEAIATTSSGFAATLGRLDGGVTREEAIAHAAVMATAVDIPVSTDLENCFADDPEGVAETISLALAAGVAGASVEDYSLIAGIYDANHAAQRVAAAAEAAHAGPNKLVLTARAENLIRDRDDLADTIARLQAYEAAGADVLFAPGLRSLDAVKAVVDAVHTPVSVLAVPGLPPVADLAEAGVRRISVGGAFAYAAISATVDAARELLDDGTYGYWDRTAAGAKAARAAFTPPTA